MNGKGLAPDPAGPPADGSGLRIAVVTSRFNAAVTEALAGAAVRTLCAAGVAETDIEWHEVPGAFELPLAVELLLRRGGLDGVVALGCVIRGETPHFEYVCRGAATGLEAAARAHAVPVGFGLLTTDDAAQARARAGGDRGNKGEEAARAVLEMCSFARSLR
ncbi:MAG: 6,7-dimethyl-8-ribityllumazine synthase [Gemmatimonadota bacterium]|nr:6,7-dimethyl-8-ribityllumazine synthase [Gemmatimonadota bacterium]